MSFFRSLFKLEKTTEDEKWAADITSYDDTISQMSVPQAKEEFRKALLHVDVHTDPRLLPDAALDVLAPEIRGLLNIHGFGSASERRLLFIQRNSILFKKGFQAFWWSAMISTILWC
jgi:hypothetical protein